MAETGWAEWLQGQLDARGWNQSELSRRTDGAVTRAQVSKWLKREHVPELDKVRAVCVAVGVPPVEGMIAAGHLTPDDVGAVVVAPTARPLSDYGNRELLGEIARRLDRQVAAPARDGSVIEFLAEDAPGGANYQGDDEGRRA